MDTRPQILVFSGSIRSGSYNTLLARLAHQLLQENGAASTLIDLAEFDLPIYNGDLQQNSGIPERAMHLKQRLKAADGFLIASPEHNMSLSALLKNTIDWVSRPTPSESGKAPFEGKVAGLCSASSGGMGGQRGLLHLRLVLTGLGVHVLPSVVSIGNAGSAFEKDGGLKDAAQAAALRSLAQAAVRLARQLRSGAAEIAG